jgi:hypothetical protein
MSLLDEQRTQIVEENTGQADFLDILENLSPTTTDIILQKSLSGDIDGEVLEKCAFTGITSIVFAPGNITSLQNLPGGVTKVICAENYLGAVPAGLPASIVELDLCKNAIRQAEGVQWPRDLLELSLSENPISGLDNLPDGLEVLRVENCRLKVLRLDGLYKLRVLHCSGNPGLVIENVPESLEDFQSDNDVLREIGKLRDEEGDKEAPEKRADYQECLRTYFQLKQGYQDRAFQIKQNTYRETKTKKEWRMKRRTLKPKCIYCDRPVGSIFENKGRSFIARCGDKAHPCPFHIELFGGEYSHVAEKMEDYEKLMHITKESIIRTKMDVLFQYLSEKSGVDVFKDVLDYYTKDTVHYTSLKKEYDDLYFNEELKEKIEKKDEKIAKTQDRISELFKTYRGDDNIETLKDAMTVYISELLPEIQSSAILRYPTREIFLSEDDKSPSILFQRSWRPQQIEYTFGEYPRVIHYKVR